MKTANTIELEAMHDDIETIKSKFKELSLDARIEVANRTMELFALEPKRKGRPPTGFILRYKRLSITSKIVITRYINRALEDEQKGKLHYKRIESKAVATSKTIVIDFKKAIREKKEESLLCDSFVAYETDWRLGVKGYLRHKFNCKDKSRDNLMTLINDMNKSLSLLDSEEIQKDIKYRQHDNCVMLDKPISQTVTDLQKKILQHIQNTCESELLIDLCNDYTVRVINNWNVSLIFSYEGDSKDIFVRGKDFNVENFLAGRNAYF